MVQRTRGEGRSGGEKGQGVIIPYEVRKAKEKARLEEEKAWADKSGPVEVRHRGVRRDLR